MTRGVCAVGVLMWLCSLAVSEASAAERPSGPADPLVSEAQNVCTAAEPRLPVNVRVDRLMIPRIQVMLRRSPTFRGQCRLLAAHPWVHVKARYEPSYPDHRGYMAYSVIQRPQPHLMIAVVTLRPLSDPAVWLAHEFEHLIEQIESIDLDRLAEAKRTVWRSGNGMFETMRALRAGETVLGEVIQRPETTESID